MEKTEKELEVEIARLNAKAAHLTVKARLQQKELARRRDAHEKIVLGACVKKVGLDQFCRQSTKVVKSDIAGFDVALLTGALAALNEQLVRDAEGRRGLLPNDETLRANGRRLLGGRHLEDEGSGGVGGGDNA